MARVINAIDIEGFRGLQEVRIAGLRRVNILVGDNGSGKTAVLEAIHLAASSGPQAAMQVRTARHFPPVASRIRPGATVLAGASEVDEAMWADLFPLMDMDGRIFISLSFDDQQRRDLLIAPASSGVLAMPLDQTPPTPSSDRPPMTLRWSVGGETKTEAKFERNGSWAFNANGAVDLNRTLFIPALHTAHIPAAQWLSDLEKSGRSARFEHALREQFPQVEAISVQLDSGVPNLYVRLAGQSRMLPINALSAGMAKLAELLLSAATFAGGALLIDEIENGFHHSRHELLWRQLRAASELYDTQIFASVHSWECLEAAIPTMREHPDDFLLIRMARHNGRCEANALPGLDASELIDNNLEVRG